MQKIAAKKSKKKIKRQQQKLNKQLTDMNHNEISTQPNMNEEYDIVERIQNMKIN